MNAKCHGQCGPPGAFIKLLAKAPGGFRPGRDRRAFRQLGQGGLRVRVGMLFSRNRTCGPTAVGPPRLPLPTWPYVTLMLPCIQGWMMQR
jgi:hypothetical protein